MKPNSRPTHVYVARKDCGCCIGIASDMRDRETGEGVAEWIGDGYTVDRVDWNTYRESVCKEETFMSCPHGQLALAPATP